MPTSHLCKSHPSRTVYEAPNHGFYKWRPHFPVSRALVQIKPSSFFSLNLNLDLKQCRLVDLVLKYSINYQATLYPSNT